MEIDYNLAVISLTSCFSKLCCTFLAQIPMHRWNILCCTAFWKEVFLCCTAQKYPSSAAAQKLQQTSYARLQPHLWNTPRMKADLGHNSQNWCTDRNTPVRPTRAWDLLYNPWLLCFKPAASSFLLYGLNIPLPTLKIHLQWLLNQ